MFFLQTIVGVYICLFAFSLSHHDFISLKRVVLVVIRCKGFLCFHFLLSGNLNVKVKTFSQVWFTYTHESTRREYLWILYVGIVKLLQRDYCVMVVYFGLHTILRHVLIYNYTMLILEGRWAIITDKSFSITLYSRSRPTRYFYFYITTRIAYVYHFLPN